MSKKDITIKVDKKPERVWVPDSCKRAAGIKFNDRRTKRLRTRGSQNRKAINEQ